MGISPFAGGAHGGAGAGGGWEWDQVVRGVVGGVT